MHLSRRLKCTIVITQCPSSFRSSLTFHMFDFSETAERNSTKLDRKQDLNILNQVCVFFGLISKQKWTSWPIRQKVGTLYSGARYDALCVSCFNSLILCKSKFASGLIWCLFTPGCLFTNVQINLYIYAIAFTCPKNTPGFRFYIYGPFSKIDKICPNSRLLFWKGKWQRSFKHKGRYI